MGLITSGEYIIKIDYLQKLQDRVKKMSHQTTTLQEITIPIDPKTLKPWEARKYLRKQLIKSRS